MKKSFLLAIVLLVATSTMAFATGDYRIIGHLPAVTSPASTDELMINDSSELKKVTVGNLVGTVTAAELNNLDASVNEALMTMGTGADGMDEYAYAITTLGGMTITRILVDIDGLNAGATADDIIGEDGIANAHLGQITAAVNGAIHGCTITVLEALAGGDTTISMSACTEGTGAEDAAKSGLTCTEPVAGLDGSAVTNAGNCAAAIAADKYLYLTGDTGGDATYTAGKLLITLYGTK